MAEPNEATERTLYELVGGMETFRRLVDAFYARVEADKVLRPVFPEDMEGNKRSQYLFLAQFFGGPTTYSEERGHPRLRMRHVPFVIGPTERDAWYEAMVGAIRSGGLAPVDEDAFLGYFDMAATAMINQRP